MRPAASASSIWHAASSTTAPDGCPQSQTTRRTYGQTGGERAGRARGPHQMLRGSHDIIQAHKEDPRASGMPLGGSYQRQQGRRQQLPPASGGRAGKVTNVAESVGSNPPHTTPGPQEEGRRNPGSLQELRAGWRGRDEVCHRRSSWGRQTRSCEWTSRTSVLAGTEIAEAQQLAGPTV